MRMAGPWFHLPYFWSQKSHRAADACPEIGSLHRSDKTWRSWRPRLPVSVLGRIPALKGPPAPSPPAPQDAPAPALTEKAEVGPPQAEAAHAKQEVKREASKPGKEAKRLKEHKKSKKSKEEKEAKRARKQKKEKKDGLKRSAEGPKLRSKKEKKAEAPIVEPPPGSGGRGGGVFGLRGEPGKPGARRVRAREVLDGVEAGTRKGHRLGVAPKDDRDAHRYS